MKKKAAAEAVLFASGEPVALSRIADALDVSQETAQELLESLRQEYDGRNSGLQIRRLERQYQMCAVRLVRKRCAARWICAATPRFPRRPWKCWRW